MGVLAPIWLLLGTAIAVPLIIHLLQRHQGPRFVFPAVRYLMRAEREHARRIRLRQLLLLLLRLLVVLFIAFAAARPFLRGAGVGHEPTAVVLILDNSLSSGRVEGDRRVLDELKDRALETLERAGTDDRFWLLRAGSPWEPALPGDAATIATRVRETQPSAGRADIVVAIDRARSILAQGADGRATEIQILSDLQSSNLHGAPAGAKDDELGVLLYAPERKESPNASITAVTVGGGLAPRANERSSVVAEIGGTRKDSLSVRLTLDNRIAGAAVTRPGAAAVIPFPARPAGMIMGELQIDADALRGDDRRFFVAAIAPPPRVSLTRTTPFVTEALGVLAGANRIALTGGSPDVVIAPAGAGAESAGPGSSVVIIAPTSPLELPAVNRRLAALGVNWRYELRGPTGELRFANAAGADDLLRGLAAARVRHAFRLTPVGSTPGDSVTLRLEDNSPWAVRGSRARGGRFVLFASPMTDSASTLPTSAAMIPLLDRATGIWSVADAPRAEVRPGERVMLPEAVEQIIDPDGNRHDVKGAEAFADAIEPGVYRVVANGKAVGAFVVNPDATESVLRYADPKRAERVLAPLEVKRVDDADGWRDNIYARRVGREFWRPLLLALLALLIGESLAAATGRTARAPVTSPAES